MIIAFERPICYEQIVAGNNVMILIIQNALRPIFLVGANHINATNNSLH